VKRISSWLPPATARCSCSNRTMAAKRPDPVKRGILRPTRPDGNRDAWRAGKPQGTAAPRTFSDRRKEIRPDQLERRPVNGSASQVAPQLRL